MEKEICSRVLINSCLRFRILRFLFAVNAFYPLNMSLNKKVFSIKLQHEPESILMLMFV